VPRIEQSGRRSLRRPKLLIKGGSAPEEEEDLINCTIFGGKKLLNIKCVS